jgi:integrase
MPRKRKEGTRAPNGAATIYQGTDGRWHGRVTMGVHDNGRPDRRHVIPGLGSHRLDRLEAEQIEKLYKRLHEAGLRPATVHQVHRTLRASLNEALRRGRIVTNPALIAKAPKLEEEEIEPLTVADAQRILAAATKRRNGLRFALGIVLGFRQGEALGFRWTDYQETPDGKDRILTVHRAVQRHTWRHGCDPVCGRKRGADCPARRGGGLAVVATKSRAGRRTVGIPRPLHEWFDRHRDEQARDRAAAGELWNDARHTAATMLLVLKVPTRAVMDVMGWSQASMATRYQHVPVEVLLGIAGQVGGLLWAPADPTEGTEEGDDGAAGVLAPTG